MLPALWKRHVDTLVKMRQIEDGAPYCRNLGRNLLDPLYYACSFLLTARVLLMTRLGLWKRHSDNFFKKHKVIESTPWSNCTLIEPWKRLVDISLLTHRVDLCTPRGSNVVACTFLNPLTSVCSPRAPSDFRNDVTRWTESPTWP
jgi:hypothetical protein